MIEIRTAGLPDLEQVLGWAAAEGWNPGQADAAAFLAADPAGFFVATKDGTPVAAISVVNHNPDFAFLGLYLVVPACRGRGIGLTLWTHALAHAGTRTVGLDGVPAQQGNYAASGFAHAGGTTRFVGAIASAPHADIRPARTGDLPALIGLEAAASGAEKPTYLTEWFRDTDTRKTLVLDRAGTVAGFCTVRKCRVGAKIGPLWAMTEPDAAAVMRHAAGVFDGEIMIDVPGASDGLTALCRRLSLAPGFETARMYRGPHRGGGQSFYAVASLELG